MINIYTFTFSLVLCTGHAVGQMRPTVTAPGSSSSTNRPSLPEFTGKRLDEVKRVISESTFKLPQITENNVLSAVDYIMQTSALKHRQLDLEFTLPELTENRFLQSSEADLLSKIQEAAFSSMSPDVIIQALANRTKRIYGSDDRTDIQQLEVLAQIGNDAIKKRSASIIEAAASVCCMTNTSKVHQDDTGGYLVQYEKPALCMTERFHDQPQLGFGTAFLVAPDMILTAAHCVEEASDISKISFIFDFKVPEGGGWGQMMVGNFLRFPSTSVRFGKTIVKKVKNGTIDWALVKLDKPIERQSIIKLLSRPLGLNDKTLVIGHPHGLPLKVADNGSISKIDKDRSFHCNLDTYGGNSGSPVFIEGTLELAGILVSGGKDWKRVPMEGGCLVSIYAGSNDKGSEGVTQIRQVSPSLSH